MANDPRRLSAKGKAILDAMEKDDRPGMTARHALECLDVIGEIKAEMAAAKAWCQAEIEFLRTGTPNPLKPPEWLNMGKYGKSRDDKKSIPIK